MRYDVEMSAKILSKKIEHLEKREVKEDKLFFIELLLRLITP